MRGSTENKRVYITKTDKTMRVEEAKKDLSGTQQMEIHILSVIQWETGVIVFYVCILQGIM